MRTQRKRPPKSANERQRGGGFTARQRREIGISAPHGREATSKQGDKTQEDDKMGAGSGLPGFRNHRQGKTKALKKPGSEHDDTVCRTRGDKVKSTAQEVESGLGRGRGGLIRAQGRRTCSRQRSRKCLAKNQWPVHKLAGFKAGLFRRGGGPKNGNSLARVELEGGEPEIDPGLLGGTNVLVSV